MKLNFKLAEAYRGTRVELDGVIRALGGRYCGPKTIVTYQNDVIVKYLIEGRLGQNSIPDRKNAVKVEIGTAVTSIGNSAFHSCSGLTSVTIPDSVTSIGNRAFVGCSKLTSITISDSVTSIDDYAFNACSGLTSITIPGSVTSIGHGAFSSCGLTSVTISDGVKSIADDMFGNCSGLTLVTIPDSVTSIGHSAFWQCSGLTSIVIGNGVTSIGDWAFRYCTALSSITSHRSSAPTVQSLTFGGGSNSDYTGRNTYSTGDNVLKVPQGATGYDSGSWTILQNATKCGFHIEYE